MKTLAANIVAVALVCCTKAAELKIGTIDVKRVFKEYFRAEQVTRDFETRRQIVFKELSELRLDGDRLLKEAQDLQESLEDTALSLGAKEEKQRSFNLKLSDLRAFQLRYDEAKAERETELQNWLQQANKRLSEEIADATRGISEKEGFNLILNEDKANIGLAEVVFTKNVPDLTDKVLALLNSMKPTTNGLAPYKSRP